MKRNGCPEEELEEVTLGHIHAFLKRVTRTPGEIEREKARLEESEKLAKLI